MREVEPAHVIALSYIISNDGASNTCARLTLRLSDPGSPLQGRTFDVELPPATNGHAEFVIPQHRFLTSVHRMWKRGDRCQVPFLLLLALPPAVACGPALPSQSGYCACNVLAFCVLIFMHHSSHAFVHLSIHLPIPACIAYGVFFFFSFFFAAVIYTLPVKMSIHALLLTSKACCCAMTQGTTRFTANSDNIPSSELFSPLDQCDLLLLDQAFGHQAPT